MKRSIARRGALAMLVVEPLLPVGGMVVDVPARMFFIGATSINPHPNPLPKGEGGFFVEACFPRDHRCASVPNPWLHSVAACAAGSRHASPCKNGIWHPFRVRVMFSL